MSTRNLIGQEPWERRGENDARISVLLTRIGALESTVAAMANFIKATSTGRLIQSGSSVVITNGGGGATITYPTAFAAAPVVMACNGDASAADDWLMGITNSLVTTTNFEVVVVNHTGARVGGALMRVNWTAFGAA